MSSIARRFGLSAALEELDEAVEPVAADADSAESAMLEMTEAEAGVDEGLQAVEEVAQTTETLDQVADTMEATIVDEKGEDTGAGLDETAAQIAEVAVESLYKRLGIQRRKPMPAMESFGATASRQKATRVAIEGIREVASKAWAAIVEFFKKIKEFFAKLWTFVTNANARNEERAKKLAEKANGLNETAAPKEAEIGAGGFAKNLTADGTNFKSEAVAAGLEAIGMVVGIDEGQEKAAQAVAGDLTKMIADAKAFEGYKYTPPAGAVEYAGKLPEGMKAYGFANSGMMLGGVQVVVVSAEKSAEGKEGLELKAKTSVSVTAVGEFKAEKVAVASVGEQKKITAAAIKLVAGVKKSDAEVKKMNETLNALIKAAEAAQKSSKEDKEAEARGKLVRKAITSTVNVLVKGTKELGVHAVRTTKAALDYVEKSQQQFGKEEKAA